MRIPSRYDSTKVVYENGLPTIKETVEAAVKQWADLQGANLRGANLQGADLREADLQGANLQGADLQGADLRGAYLHGADGQTKARINWRSHALLSEILRRAAGGNIDHRKFAGLVAISLDWCWYKFLSMTDDPCLEWALGVLREWVQDGDEAPKCLQPAKPVKADAQA